MAIRRVRLTHAGLSLALLTCAAIARADTTLVGTSLTDVKEGPVLCPLVNHCNVRVSGFTTPAPFTLTTVQLSLSGPALPNLGPGEPTAKSADFQAYLLTDLSQTEYFTDAGSDKPVIGGTKLGSGTLTYKGLPQEPEGDVSETVTLGGLNLLLKPGQQYWIEVLGGDLIWNTGTPLISTRNNLDLQLSCDPFSSCGESNLFFYNQMSATQAMLLSGTPAATPEPETWCLLATGMFLLGAARLTSRQQALGDLPTAL